MKYDKNKGIVLLEAIIAIGVLATIFTATFALYNTSVEGIRITNDQLVATFLAQDAMESVIAKRQYNFEERLPFLDGIDGCTSSSPCNPQVGDDLSLPLAGCGGNCSLYLVSGEYVHSGGTTQLTQYNRDVVVDTASFGAHEAAVLVTVSWKDGANTQEYTLRYNLYADPNPL